MCIDETGQKDLPPPVDHAIGVEGRFPIGDGADHVAIDKDAPTADLASLSVHRRHEVEVAEECARHGYPLLRSTLSAVSRNAVSSEIAASRSS